MTDAGESPALPVPAHGLGWTACLPGAVVCARLASLPFYPMLDATEARYANFARVMLESGDWITPQMAPGAVFWGKPPLFAWAGAASMGLFGTSEFGARLPSFVAGMLTLPGRPPAFRTSRPSAHAPA